RIGRRRSRAGVGDIGLGGALEKLPELVDVAKPVAEQARGLALAQAIDEPEHGADAGGVELLSQGARDADGRGDVLVAVDGKRSRRLEDRRHLTEAAGRKAGEQGTLQAGG